MNAANDDPAEEVGIVKGGDLQLEGLLRITNRGRNVAQDGIEQRTHVVAVGLHVGLGEASETAAEQVGEIALIIVSAEFDEQIEHLVDGGLGIHPGPVDLVDEHDRTQALLEGLLQHKTGLGHRPLVGIHDQQATVNHAQHPLHFSTEIGVTRGVNDVDPGVVVGDSRVFRQDRDAPLTLQVVGVHHTGGDGLVVAENS